MSETELNRLTHLIKQWAKALGFQALGITKPDLAHHAPAIQDWLAKGYHGSMSFLERNGELRLHPELLHPGTVRIISVRMDYLPEQARFAANLESSEQAYISRYAVGRDYHKVMRKRLKQLADQIKSHCDTLDARPFVDSAPVLERPLAEEAGLGWTGKHTLLLDANAGSWFFLGELFINLPLPVSESKQTPQCGECVACLKMCPTGAIVEPYVVDARRCISYLTIEHDGAIDEELRALMGNRIYGCDDCQLICPWNRHSEISPEPDYQFRKVWDSNELITLLQWSEQEFLDNTAGSPIRRIGYEKWQRNLAIALGNAATTQETIEALEQARGHVSEMVDEHIEWALRQHQSDARQNNRKTARLIRSVKQGLPRDA